MDLATFKKRMAEHMFEALAKAVDPSDLRGVAKESVPEGHDLVDHTFHLDKHPPAHQAAVDHYRTAIAGEAPMMHTTPVKLKGMTAKAVYKLPSADGGKLPNGPQVLVKPYHEPLDKRVKFWMHAPHLGWAEMANQALWHAAEMGHMHQNVHVSEHNMGPGKENEPALVIHMEPDAKYVFDMEPQDYDPQMMRDLPKIAAMDFLTGNIDRHAANLLFLPRGVKDQMGVPKLSRLLAIDHGRSFQYHASGKGVAKKEHDPIFGTITIPEETRQSMLKEQKAKDSLLNYLKQDGIRGADRYTALNGQPPTASPQGFVPVVAEWWPKVRSKVISALHHHLNGIKKVSVRQHILKNFHERVRVLDDIAARPHYYYNEARKSDLDLPLHPFED